MIRHSEITIKGQVQGVNFRWLARENAARLSLCGFARNEPDGGVFLEVEGSAERINEFLRWCRRGPSLAKIESVEAKFSREVKGYVEFVIK